MAESLIRALSTGGAVPPAPSVALHAAPRGGGGTEAYYAMPPAKRSITSSACMPSHAAQAGVCWRLMDARQRCTWREPDAPTSETHTRRVWPRSHEASVVPGRAPRPQRDADTVSGVKTMRGSVRAFDVAATAGEYETASHARIRALSDNSLRDA